MRKKLTIGIIAAVVLVVLILSLRGCGKSKQDETGSTAESVLSGAETETQAAESQPESIPEEAGAESGAVPAESGAVIPESAEEGPESESTSPAEEVESGAEGTGSVIRTDGISTEFVAFDLSWPYASYSKIHSAIIKLYRAPAGKAKEKTVCVNAGHGTSGGTDVKTQCHPDGTPKVTGGSTGAGETEAWAVAIGTTMLDGTPEADVTLSLALIVRDRLLEAGYDVLMIRETGDVQLDNIARTVMANQKADCHIALHYDYTENDKGAYYMSVPNIDSYRAMEPVASIYEEHGRLGESVISGLSEAGAKIFADGPIAQDLTQTSYSTVPSIDLEVGDRGSPYTPDVQGRIAEGVVKGVEIYFS